MASLLKISKTFIRYSVVNTLKICRHNKIRTTQRYFSAASALQQNYNHGFIPALGSAGDIKKMYDQSMNHPDSFWGAHGRNHLHWIEDFQKVSNSDIGSGKHEWFLGGKLNVSGIIFTFFLKIVADCC